MTQEGTEGSRDAPPKGSIVPADAAAVRVASHILRRGGLVAFPTETVYGLGAAARDPVAVARIFGAKGRPSHHPLIVHLGDPGWLPDWAEAPPAAAHVLANRFWPGPLTLVLQRGAAAPDAVTGGASTIGLRMPAHPVALALLDTFGDAIAAPSANRFGRISPTRASHVAEELGGSIDLILDGGACEVGVESTIIDLTGEAPRLLRPGGIAVEAIEEVLGRAVAEVTGEAPRAPGRLASHYAPSTPTLALDRTALAAEAGPGDAVVAFGSAPVGSGARWTVLPDHPSGAARDLYAALRAVDAEQPRRILVQLPPDVPAWRAVRDRILRAAHAR